jgi:exopolysaccharide biosynthesis predicted pyruvyltransferase EpsI
MVFDTQVLSMSNWWLVRRLASRALPDDLVFLHSGYHTTDLYRLENDLNKNIAHWFTGQSLVALPQTVHYRSEAQLAATAAAFASHPRLKLLVRDPESLRTAIRAFPSAWPELFPDLVTSLIGTRRYHSERGGIALCLRNDQESAVDLAARGRLVRSLACLAPITETDTTVRMNGHRLARQRAAALEKYWQFLAAFRVVVTDRFHGIVFALIAGTPVVVLPSADHKVSSSLTWFADDRISDFVAFASTLEEAVDQAAKILGRPAATILPERFGTKYFERLGHFGAPVSRSST